MPDALLLDIVPLWGLFLATSVVILLSQESGYRLGQARGRHTVKESDSPLGGMVGAQLGLLAFLLAFTFGLATSRYDARRTVLLDEANAIGTLYLRTSMLPDAQRVTVRGLVREYVDIRVAALQDGSLSAALRRSEELHERLWSEAVTSAAHDPHSIQIGLFVEALNEVIDLHSERVTAGLRSRIPTMVWVVLLAVTVLSFMAMGYQAGLTRSSRSPASLVVALTFAAVFLLVVDLDRPGEGLLRVSQQPLIELQNSMKVVAQP
jgi:hypothetical protein